MIQLERILFPSDFSERADDALEHATFLAKRYRSTLHLLHVSEESVGDDERARIETALDDLRRRVSDSERDVVVAVRSGEAPAPEIVRYAADERISLIVTGTHGRRGVRRIFMGSTAEEVVRTAPCPVYSIRQEDVPTRPRAAKRVLVPIDFSEYGEISMRAAMRFVEDDGEIHLVHAVEEFVPPGVYGLEYPSYHEISNELESHARREMDRMASEMFGGKIRHVAEVQRGYAPGAVIEYAEANNVDVILMSTHGRSGFERMLLGSVTEKVVRMSPIPVLIVPSFRERDDQS